MRCECAAGEMEKSQPNVHLKTDSHLRNPREDLPAEKCSLLLCKNTTFSLSYCWLEGKSTHTQTIVSRNRRFGKNWKNRIFHEHISLKSVFKCTQMIKFATEWVGKKYTVFSTFNFCIKNARSKLDCDRLVFCFSFGRILRLQKE